MESIYENNSKLGNKDILHQCLLVVSLFTITYLIGPFLRPSMRTEEVQWAFFIIGVLTLIYICSNAYRETLVVLIAHNKINRELKIVVHKRIKGYGNLTLHSDLKYELVSIPSKSLPPIKELTIHDSKNKIKMSNRQNGIDNETLERVLNKLKIYYP